MIEIRRLYVIGIILSFSLSSLPQDALAQNESIAPKYPASNSALKNADVLKSEVSQFEECHNNKTFQVAKILIKATPEVVFKTLTDYDRAPQIFSYLKKSKILTVDGNRKTISCEAELAGGLFKFEYVLEFTEHAPSAVEWHRVSGAFKSNEGFWKFEPINKGKSTLVTYGKYVDGGLLFPQFLIKKELRNNMPVILGELKRSSEQSTN